MFDIVDQDPKSYALHIPYHSFFRLVISGRSGRSHDDLIFPATKGSHYHLENVV